MPATRLLSLVAVLAMPLAASAQKVTLTPSDRGLRVEIDGKLFSEYRTTDAQRPYMYPIIGPSGENLARPYPMEEGGAKVDYCDPFFPVARAGRKHDIGLQSVPCTAAAFAAYDALVISTAHNQFKDASLYAGVGLVIDSRNIVKAGPAGPKRVVKA